jgi:hypothetical protein
MAIKLAHAQPLLRAATSATGVSDWNSPQTKTAHPARIKPIAGSTGMRLESVCSLNMSQPIEKTVNEI